MEEKTNMMRGLFVALMVLVTIFVSCGTRPNINGGDTDQPIMDGWTIEYAAEFWLASVLSEEHTAIVNGEGQWLTPDSLAHLTKGHVHVDLPVHEGNPMPRWGVMYRQPQTGGFVTFRDSASLHPTVSGDTLQSIGQVHFHFLDGGFGESADTTVFVQSRGKGLFTGFLMNRVRKYKDDGSWQWSPNGNPEWFPMVISVYPDGDSLVVSRGIWRIETFVVEK